MSTPDAEDASPSPEYRSDPDESDMAAEQKSEAHDGDESPQQKTANGKPASNAKDPLRPRRKKARRACFACQRAHLTCGDERPCNRCIKRSLQDHCIDGVRKKAKYLHDAPDGALLPGVGANYHHLNGHHQVQQPLPGQDPGAASMAQQGNYYAGAPSTGYYPQNPSPAQAPVQDAPVVGQFNHQQAPISPPYSRPNPAIIASVPSTGPQPQMQQFGGPLFDPSDPALFNFDISSLNFGNHYGALELGMLGHISSGAAETLPSDNNMMNNMNPAPGMYNPQMSYNENANLPAHISFGPNGMPAADWHNAHSRQGSLQMQTPHNTPTTTNLDHSGHRHDSMNGPQAFHIGQGPSSLSSASPASTDIYDNDHPPPAATFFAHPNQQQAHQQRSPTVSRPRQENRMSNAVLQPIHSNALRKRRRDTRWIYEDITKPYDYVRSYHTFFMLIRKKCTSASSREIVSMSLGKFRPVLMGAAGDLDRNDLIHQERNLQRSLLTLKEHQAELATPSILCRRSGEIVGLNAEFTQLTGWTSDILLGKAPNLNVNTGVILGDPSESSTQTSTTPSMNAQEPESGPRSVNIIELMDERSALEWLEDFSNLSYGDPRGTASRRVNMIRYRTKEDIVRLEEAKGSSATNEKHVKGEPSIKQETRMHEGEMNIHNVVSKDGLIDCMITWLIKRDNFDIPMLVSMQVMPVL